MRCRGVDKYLNMREEAGHLLFQAASAQTCLTSQLHLHSVTSLPTALLHYFSMCLKSQKSQPTIPLGLHSLDMLGSKKCDFLTSHSSRCWLYHSLPSIPQEALISGQGTRMAGWVISPSVEWYSFLVLDCLNVIEIVHSVVILQAYQMPRH